MRLSKPEAENPRRTLADGLTYRRITANTIACHVLTADPKTIAFTLKDAGHVTARATVGELAARAPDALAAVNADTFDIDCSGAPDHTNITEGTIRTLAPYNPYAFTINADGSASIGETSCDAVLRLPNGETLPITAVSPGMRSVTHHGIMVFTPTWGDYPIRHLLRSAGLKTGEATAFLHHHDRLSLLQSDQYPLPLPSGDHLVIIAGDPIARRLDGSRAELALATPAGIRLAAGGRELLVDDGRPLPEPTGSFTLVP